MKMLIIVPTRGRNQNHLELIESWQQFTEGKSQILLGLDDDDQQNYTRVNDPFILYDVNPRLRLGGTLNLLATKYAKHYDVIAFLGDDHRFRSGFESVVEQAIDNLNGMGIIYGNDLLQGEKLPTAVFMSSNIINTLGFMVPPEMVHLYLDNFWLDLGNALNCITYKPEMIVEHMHYSNGKSQADSNYLEVNSPEMYSHDQQVYDNYKATQFSLDVKKLKKNIDTVGITKI